MEKNMNNKKVASALVLILIILTGCATINISKSVSPATLKEQWNRESFCVWGGPRVYSIGNIVTGYGRENGSTYIVDQGSTVMRVYYYANRGNLNGVFTQTNLVDISLVLEKNGHYELRALAGESTVVFSVINLSDEREVATTSEVPIILGAPPLYQ
jgi:hypothetical protein